MVKDGLIPGIPQAGLQNDTMNNEENRDAFHLGEQKDDTAFLRAVAALLIINSHLGAFYPIEHLASGGMIGNSLFFMLAAFGLYISWNRGKKRVSFINWYARRVARIYPSVWLTLAFVVLPTALVFPTAAYMEPVRMSELLKMAGMFFYPPFWFLQALMIYYSAFFIILKHFSHTVLLRVSVLLLLLYALCYLTIIDLSRFAIEVNPFNMLFYFLVSLSGFYLGAIRERIRFTGCKDIALIFFSAAGIYAHKYFMTKGLLMPMQFVQHLLVFPLLLGLMRSARSGFVVHTVMGSKHIGKGLRFISRITLELYIVQMSLKDLFEKMQVDFPWNAMVFIASCIGAAFFIHACSSPIRRMLTGSEVDPGLTPLPGAKESHLK